MPRADLPDAYEPLSRDETRTALAAQLHDAAQLVGRITLALRAHDVERARLHAIQVQQALLSCERALDA